MPINGTVKFFDHSRGFGFIAPDGGSKDVFVHVTAMESAGIASIDEGDKLSFEAIDDPRGRGKTASDLQML
ncbi:cold-shock protein [Pseudovibrio exalbescens]|uniref:Cold-shock protein n=1 Tax=Pseudovibrio exalbescens TaxID=197461 RepID=A0A1U7JGF6_9HYPH|nr:cold-shock protein [Pseudovibrio exalbescens]OKL43772.1 cold-shock protein [Pseudovibrio exalbescens]